ncbi:uncharacterized protein C1orf141 homolog isoform X2 [Rhinatrema bivittatum]|uniref:uncharacterized protein C1orf141 homolog isoform X2 n=1 Tax=Rhinatrema bivittatum TaxID=194408 RepID=UPI00112DF1AE|nr:uncharacterized protein C1orf141 homolog isoform X2 [Rhinatrema bivittatum]XP_029473377.1 uncharacterized protein C1orf141 homolog isoform X2 [Rhinatrema bivittatum]
MQSSTLEPPATARRSIGHNRHVRPFSVPEHLKIKPNYQKESKTLKEGISNVTLKSKSKSAGYGKSMFRRAKWITEVEGIPKLDILCQNEWKTPIGSVLEHADISHWYSLTVAHSPQESTILTGDEADLHRIYSEVGKLIANQVQRDKKSQADRSDQLHSANLNSRKVCCKKDSSDHNEQQCSKITLHPSDSASKDKTDFISLSLEDEMKKSNVKIISIKPQRARSPYLRLSETYPIIDDNEFSHKNFTNMRLCSDEDSAFSESRSEKKPQSDRGKPVTFTRVNPVVQDSLNYTRALFESKQKQSYIANLRKSEKLKRISSKQKINIHILSADGTSEILQLTRNKSAPKPIISKSTLSGERSVNKLSLKSGVISGTKLEFADASLILNGMNPTIDLHPETTSGRLTSTVKPKSPRFSHYRPATCSHFHTNSGLDEMVKWEYVSIAKPLTTPRYKKYLLSKKEISLSDSELVSQLSLQESSCQKAVPLGNLESTNVAGLTAIAKPLIRDEHQESTLKSTPCQKCPQAGFMEEMPTDAKLDSEKFYLEIPKGQETLQACNTSKPSVISSAMEDPQTQSDSKAAPIKEHIPPELRAASSCNRSSLPVIHIPTAQVDGSESERVKTENDFQEE